MIRLLKGQILKDRLAQTTLLVGLKGIGKRALAIQFAKAVECEQSKEGEACDRCDPCRRIAAGTFPDTLMIGPESGTGSVGIEQVRALSHAMSLTPYEGRRKVGIVEEADAFTEQAAHAVLKLLEEPPEKGLIILIATALNRLPSTLVSRCHVVRCFPQGIQRVAAAVQEKERLEPILAMRLAILSGGRIGTALEFHRRELLSKKNVALDQLLNAWRRKILEVPLGKAPRPELEEALEWFAGWWRDLLVLKLGGDPAWLIHQDRLGDLQDVIARSPAFGGAMKQSHTGELLERIERTYRVQETIQRNASPRIALSVLLSR